MQTNKKTQSKPDRTPGRMVSRRQNKDELDSREGEEQLSKGDDVTHNRKEKQHARKNLKN
ncbi:hypothetical protein LL912_05990 [Niabella sp. CC-SYL272]|uniref:hypothetical protein n=1 Tax=Niabella agricola TaxID=2891571 RepID=UPI001F302EFE|nr:hypothetical protein [Niabella agricola]MCF3108322.1 hypothetical protein [Niabella agricola]